MWSSLFYGLSNSEVDAQDGGKGVPTLGGNADRATVDTSRGTRYDVRTNAVLNSKRYGADVGATKKPILWRCFMHLPTGKGCVRMETIMQLIPLVLPIWKRLRWKFRRLVRYVRGFLLDAVVIAAGTAVVMFVWYLGFVVYPTLR